ncbi:MAG: DNA-3-methyladenine glycosylase I [Rhodoluna sp.]|nr:DNA-3-methyladenine glycosylase I [Rhodoluna sp.]
MYIDYHDTEWGSPISGDNAMFERMSLEGFQAGLSWLTILKRREGFRNAFHGFEITKVAEMTTEDVEHLLQDEGIIRHRGKIEAVINNARIARDLDGGLEAFVRSFTPIEDRRNLTKSPESEAMSKTLRKLGFNFVGPTTMHALMQAIGMVEDHSETCFRRTGL